MESLRFTRALSRLRSLKEIPSHLCSIFVQYITGMAWHGVSQGKRGSSIIEHTGSSVSYLIFLCHIFISVPMGNHESVTL